MSMTKQDYELIATVFNVNIRVTGKLMLQALKANNTKLAYEYEREMQAIVTTAEYLADRLQLENTRFDKQRFMAAVLAD